jgi:hypothetical protein
LQYALFSPFKYQVLFFVIVSHYSQAEIIPTGKNTVNSKVIHLQQHSMTLIIKQSLQNKELKNWNPPGLSGKKIIFFRYIFLRDPHDSFALRAFAF